MGKRCSPGYVGPHRPPIPRTVGLVHVMEIRVLKVGQILKGTRIHDEIHPACLQRLVVCLTISHVPCRTDHDRSRVLTSASSSVMMDVSSTAATPAASRRLAWRRFKCLRYSIMTPDKIIRTAQQTMSTVTPVLYMGASSSRSVVSAHYRVLRCRVTHRLAARRRCPRIETQTRPRRARASL